LAEFAENGRMPDLLEPGLQCSTYTRDVAYFIWFMSNKSAGLSGVAFGYMLVLVALMDNSRAAIKCIADALFLCSS